MKLKRKSRTVIKVYDGEKYFFRNGVAKVPGVRGLGSTITLKEFNELKEEK